MELALDGKVALVTGSYRGTGAGIARVLAAEGAQVAVHGLEAGQADPVVAEIGAAGGWAFPVDGDVRSDAGAERTARMTLEAAGRVDLLINNFGRAEGGGWFDGTSEDWLGMFHTNVLSGVRLVRRLVPGMRERGFGRVVLVGTVGAERPRAVMPGYYASKAALPNMAVSLAKELAGTGVTVNLVSPGILATAEVRESLERRARREGWPDDWEEIERRAAHEVMPNPSGRLGRVEEVGQLVAFLCSHHAGYINGSTLRIDGGAADCV